MAFKVKDLFITKSDEAQDKPEEKEKENKFPTQTTPVSNDESTLKFPSSFTPTASKANLDLGNDHLDKFSEMYQNGFNSLNKDGYDFYEFFQALVTSGGIDNPQMYVMAMSMGNAMDKSVTKSTLISQADYYLGEITKVYTEYVNKGNAKREELLSQKQNENQSLTSELSNLRSQLEALNNQIRSKESQLSTIDSKYQSLIGDIENKLNANDAAKNKLIGDISKVKNGINLNIK